MTHDKLFAIVQVRTMNRDVAELLESKGVTRDDIMEVYRAACGAVRKKPRKTT